MAFIDNLRRLLSNRPLACLVGVGAISALGDWLYLAALPILVYQWTGEAAMVGLIGAARLLPALVLSVPAGLVADRVQPRSVLVISEAVRALCMLVIACLCLIGADIWWVLAVAVVAASAGTFALPASGALVPRLARDDDELGRANALYSGLDGIANIVGPALAGVLVVTGSLPVAFALNGLTFGAMVVAIFGLVPHSAPGRPRSSTEAGGHGADRVALRDIARRIARPIALDGAISFASTALGVLSVIIAVEALNAGAGFAGALSSAAGAGALVGGLATAAVVNRRDRRGLLLALVAALVALPVLGTTSSPIVALCAMATAVAAMVTLDTLNTTSIQRLTADGTTGRAFGLLHASAALFWIAGSIVPALAASTLGPSAAVVLTTIVVALLGAGALLPAPKRARPRVASTAATQTALGSPDPAVT
jgi:hypothetical protein